jgi:hypothetical protein
MYISEAEFMESCRILADACSRPFSEKLSLYWYKKIRVADAGKVVAAMNIFVTRGKWPSLEDLMEEVGVVPPMDRKEKEAVESRERNTPKPDTNDEYHDARTSYGDMVFSIKERQGENARANRWRQKLIELGWTIYKEYKYENLDGMTGGKINMQVKDQRTVIHAERWK